MMYLYMYLFIVIERGGFSFEWFLNSLFFERGIFYGCKFNKLKEDLGGEGPLANVALAKIHSFLQDNGGKDYKNLNLPASTVKKLLKLDNPEAWQGTAGFKPCDKNKVARRVSQLVTLLNQKGRGSTRLGDAIDWLKERSGPYSDDLQESGCLSWFRSFCRNATKSSINTKINVLLGSPQRLTTPVNLNS